MPAPSTDGSPPRILPTLILWGVGLVVAITVVGWVIGAILSVLRMIVLVVLAVAVIWAVVAARSDR